MDQIGRLAPSANMSINFRAIKNEQENINSIQNLQIKNSEKLNVKTKIYNEKGAPFVIVKTNLCERPLKFLIDTGAAISLITDDVLSKRIHKIDYEVSVFGIIGRDVSIRTQGMVAGILNVENKFLGTMFHVVKREYLCSADAYLGYDFLSPYKALIDMTNMLLRICTEDSFCIKDENEIKNELKIEDKYEMNDKNDEKENFMSILAQNYDFEEQKSTNINVRQVHLYNLNTFDRIDYILKNLKLKNCKIEEVSFVRKICENFPYQFYLEGDMLSSTDVIKHEIKLIPNAKTVNIRQYRIPESHRKILSEIINDYEKQGIIEKCQSNYNSPAILVSKKDELGDKNDYRFVVDYRKLNMITEIHNFPIPLIDDILNGLSGCEFFTTLDIKGAFHQIVMEESSRNYTAFTVNNFQYRWCRMPMGLSNSPLTFQRKIVPNICFYDGEMITLKLINNCIVRKVAKIRNSSLRISKLFEGRM